MENIGTAVADMTPAGGGSDATPEIPGTPTDTGAEGGGDGSGAPPDGDGEPAEGVEGEPPEADPDAELPEEEDGTGEEFDGRQVDAKTRSALAELKKTNPELAKKFLGDYHRTQAIIKETGAENISDAVQKVRAMSATLESVGGPEGIQNLNTEVEEYRTEIKQFGAGDPALVGELFEANPEGLGTAVSNALELMAQKNLDLFDNTVVPAMVNRMEKAGWYEQVPNLLEAIKVGDGDAAWKIAQNISKWLNDAKGLQKKVIESKDKVDPREQQFQQRERELNEREVKTFETQVGTDVNRMNNRSMAKTVEPFFKEMKLAVEGRREFVNGLQSRIWKQMKEDKVFQLQAATIKKSKDVQKLAEFISADFAKRVPETFRQYRNIMYPNYKPSVRLGLAKPAAVTPGQKPGIQPKPDIKVPVGMRPKNKEVNWDMTSDLEWQRGVAVLVNGKRVKFDPNAPPNNPYKE